MRSYSIITAIIVAASLYLLVIEREAVMAFAQGDAPALADSEDMATTNEESAVPVVALKSAAREIDSSVLLRGQTEAARQVDVRAETSGLVISDPIRKGAFVEEDQLLCRIEPGTREVAIAETKARLAEARARLPEARARVLEAEAGLPAASARVLEAEARLQEAMLNLNAAKSLAEDGFASETRVLSAEAAAESARAGIQTTKSQFEGANASVQSAQSGVEAAMAGIQSAEAAVASAERELERVEISAPFSGLLESDTAELGALMQPGGLCATIIQLDPIKLVGYVPEIDVDRITLGAPVGARLASGTDTSGVVTFVSRSADATTRTFRVEVEVDNADLKIRDGQTAEMLIQAEGRTAHILPQSALTLNDLGDIGVRVVEAGTARFLPVTVLRDTLEGIWVTGLPDTVEVIVVGQEFVTDGIAVTASYREAG